MIAHVRIQQSFWDGWSMQLTPGSVRELLLEAGQALHLTGYEGKIEYTLRVVDISPASLTLAPEGDSPHLSSPDGPRAWEAPVMTLKCGDSLSLETNWLDAGIFWKISLY